MLAKSLKKLYPALCVIELLCRYLKIFSGFLIKISKIVKKLKLLDFEFIAKIQYFNKFAKLEIFAQVNLSKISKIDFTQF